MFYSKLLVILLPLVFSHLFVPFGLAPDGWSSFERIKVIVFLLLLIAILLERSTCVRPPRDWYLWIACLTLPWFTVMFAHVPIVPFLTGTHEKWHGYLFFGGLILWGYICQTYSRREWGELIRLSLITGGVVAGIGVWELLFGSPFFPGSLATTWEGVRIISTLGNPNYLAGYLLMLLPLIPLGGFPSSWRYFLVCILISAIVATKSLFAILLLGVLGGCWLFLNFSSWGYRTIMILTLIFLLGLGWSILPLEKLLSLESRWILWSSFPHLLSLEWLYWLLGVGPDRVITLFEMDRPESIRAYFPDDQAIDSFHSIGIDLMAQYGILITLLLMAKVWRSWRYLSKEARYAGFLGILYFSLNVIVITPLFLMILLIAHDPTRDPEGASPSTST